MHLASRPVARSAPSSASVSLLLLLLSLACRTWGQNSTQDSDVSEDGLDVPDNNSLWIVLFVAILVLLCVGAVLFWWCTRGRTAGRVGIVTAPPHPGPTTVVQSVPAATTTTTLVQQQQPSAPVVASVEKREAAVVTPINVTTVPAPTAQVVEYRMPAAVSADPSVKLVQTVASPQPVAQAVTVTREPVVQQVVTQPIERMAVATVSPPVNRVVKESKELITSDTRPGAGGSRIQTTTHVVKTHEEPKHPEQTVTAVQYTNPPVVTSVLVQQQPPTLVTAVPVTQTDTLLVPSTRHKHHHHHHHHHPGHRVKPETKVVTVIPTTNVRTVEPATTAAVVTQVQRPALVTQRIITHPVVPETQEQQQQPLVVLQRLEPMD